MLGASTGFVLGMTWSCVTSGNAYRLPDGVEARLALLEVEHVFPTCEERAQGGRERGERRIFFEASRQG